MDNQPIDLQSLSVEQLTLVSKQLEEDIEFLQTSYTKLKIAQNKFSESGEAIEQLKICQGTESFLPLTSSLYVKGKISQTDKVMLDVGTGYFIEKSLEDGKDYTQRKVKDIEDKAAQIEEAMQQKRRAMTSVQMILQAKVMNMYQKKS